MHLDLLEAMATLGQRDRELIALRYGADLKAKDIAALLGKRTDSIEVALHRALERLRRALKGDGEPRRDPQRVPPHEGVRADHPG